MGLRMEENTLTARIRMLEEMEKHYEGYSKSVKTVMEQAAAGRLGGVHGPVASLITVPEPYTIAIEIALGSATQNLVVETEQHGKAVLQELRRKDVGRVTCLPLTAIRASKFSDQGFSNQKGYLGIASELLQVDVQYEKIISYLLGRVVVVQDLDSGIAMARQYGYRFRIVTLDGQVLSPGGAMTGGSVSRKGGILTRASELSSLRGQYEALKERCLASQEAQSRAKDQMLAAASALETARAAEREAEQKLLLVTEKLEGQKVKTEELRRQRDRLEAERVQLNRKTTENQDQGSKAQERIVQIEAASLERQTKKAAWEAEREALLNQKEGLLEALRESKTKLAVCETERRLSSQSLLELRAMQETRLLGEQKRNEEMAALEQETKTLLVQCDEEVLSLVKLQEEKTSLLEKRKALQQDKLELEAKRSRTDRESRSQSEMLLYAQRETALLEQKKLSLEQEEAQLLGKLWDQYEITHEAARAICNPVQDPAQTERQITTLKGEIRALGHVNLGAIEEYERISERYEYLENQKRDVEEAAAQLVEIIEAIVGEMKTIFKREFSRINEAFGETFVTLFQGGKAELLLEDERDILNCGIEIKAQPPGKSLKNLSLLSGGERAFVAIALYFSILKVRPTPFCVLDEIEAALDDVNVLRFSRYLRSISDQTQFVVITHRRGTMEEADVLYGVTMEQQGTSRILRLNLNEAELALKGAVK
jgi:chromosome segregation protein